MRHIHSIRPARLRARIIVLLAWFAGAACAVRTTPPAPVVPPTALAGWDAVAYSEQPYDARWWRQLDDPVLEQLEQDALAANHDVRSALARLDQARAVFDEDRRNQYPKVTVGASVDVRGQTQPGFTDEPQRINTYRAGFDASWEIDLFGRVRAARPWTTT